MQARGEKQPQRKYFVTDELNNDYDKLIIYRDASSVSHCVWRNRSGLNPDKGKKGRMQLQQEAQLSPRDRAMRRVSWNLANCQDGGTI